MFSRPRASKWVVILNVNITTGLFFNVTTTFHHMKPATRLILEHQNTQKLATSNTELCDSHDREG